MQVPTRHLLVKPLSRSPSAEITRAWLYASNGVVSRDPASMARQLLLHVHSYTPAFVPKSYAERWPFITRVSVNYHRWETQSLEDGPKPLTHYDVPSRNRDFTHQQQPQKLKLQ